MEDKLYAYNDPLFPGEVFLFRRQRRFGVRCYPFLRVNEAMQIIEIGPSILARLTLTPVPFRMEDIILKSSEANEMQSLIYGTIGDQLWLSLIGAYMSSCDYE